MALLDRVRMAFAFPADLRLSAALASYRPPTGLTAPFAPGPRGHANIPPLAWTTDQPPPPPRQFAFDPAYNRHTFQSFSAPLGFEGWTIDRIRNAVAAHRLGIFLESSTLAVTILGFAPVLAALSQAIAPVLALDRYIRGGTRGLSRIVAAELEEQLVPRRGLLPSSYFPPTLWGSMAIDLRLMGFAVMQHVDGDPDPDTGVMSRYTRRWPTWATNYYRYRKTFVALTSEGPVDITNDGHFTIVADEEEPHLTGAIAALGEEVLAGRLIQQARNSWIDRYGQPKWVGTMPEKVGVMSEEGLAFFAALATIVGPQGFAALPFGSKFETVGLDSKASGSFKEGLDSVIIHIAMTLLGSDGTIRAGGEGGAGPYRAPGFWGVRDDLISRMLACIVRGVNAGHIAPYLDFNYSDGIARGKSRGVWIEPVLDIPFRDSEADARMAAHAARLKLRHEILTEERKAGLILTQERVDVLSKALELDTADLSSWSPEDDQWLIEQKIIAPDEARTRRGLDPLPDGAGSVKQLAKERLAGKDETGSPGADAPPTEGADHEGTASTGENSRDRFNETASSTAGGGA